MQAPISRPEPPFLLRPVPYYAYPRPLKQLRYPKRMTIAAGILCSDGIVLCADSEESGYIAKSQRHKIDSFNNSALVVGAGMTDFIKMTTDKLFAEFDNELPERRRQIEVEIRGSVDWGQNPSVLRRQNRA